MSEGHCLKDVDLTGHYLNPLLERKIEELREKRRSLISFPVTHPTEAARYEGSLSRLRVEVGSCRLVVMPG